MPRTYSTYSTYTGKPNLTCLFLGDNVSEYSNFFKPTPRQISTLFQSLWSHVGVWGGTPEAEGNMRCIILPVFQWEQVLEFEPFLKRHSVPHVLWRNSLEAS